MQKQKNQSKDAQQLLIGEEEQGSVWSFYFYAQGIKIKRRKTDMKIHQKVQRNFWWRGGTAKRVTVFCAAKNGCSEACSDARATVFLRSKKTEVA